MKTVLGIWGAFLILLKSPQRVRFNRVYFKIFRLKSVEDIDFLVNFVDENANIEVQKLCLEGKIS